MKKKSVLVRNEVSAPAVKPVHEVQTFTMNFMPKQCRLETLEGREHLVIPMVILTEGVHKGSSGAMYYPPDELSKTPESWNHKPIVVYHPELNGQGLSACDPDIINNRKVGVMMHTKYDRKNGRLKSEAWIEQHRAQAVDERILAAVTANEMMEVSTGVFIDKEETDGKWKEEEYDGIARNFRPDHLALLPDQIGACSIKDGAGLLRNASVTNPTDKISKRITAFLRELGITNNALSFDQIRTELNDALRERLHIPEPNPNGPWAWINEIFSNFFIYEYDGKSYQLGYSTSAFGVVLDDEQGEEVMREVKFRKVAAVNNRDQSKKQTTMNATQKKQKIDALIANKTSGWSENDRPVLDAMKDPQLEALAGAFDEKKEEPAATTNTAPAATAAVVPPVAPVINTAPAPKAMTREEWMALAPPGFAEMVNNGLEVFNEEKDKLIAIIVNHESKPFTKEQLAHKPLGELRTLARMAAPKVSPQDMPSFYGGLAPVTGNQSAEAEEVLELPTMNDYVVTPVAKK